MEFGVYIPQVGLQFDEVLDRALIVERLGFDSFWLFDHLYAPGLPQQPALEAWTLATALLAGTNRLRVGHLVLNNNFRHPALVAKMAATLDVISGGRLDLGIGSGSYRLEHIEGGFPFGTMAERTERLAESLEILTRMFSGEPATFAGQHYQIENVPNVPPPIQLPHPPLHIGGVGERHTLPLIAKYADVWNIPTYALGDWHTRIGPLEAACAAVGRDPTSIRRSLEAVLVIAATDRDLSEMLSKAERRYAGPGWGLHEGGFVGTPSAIVDRVAAQAAAGVDLFVFFPADRGGGDALHLLAEEVVPHFR